MSPGKAAHSQVPNRNSPSPAQRVLQFNEPNKRLIIYYYSHQVAHHKFCFLVQSSNNKHEMIVKINSETLLTCKNISKLTFT